MQDLDILYSDLISAQFQNYFDSSWLSFFRGFAGTGRGRRFVLEKSVRGVPLLLALLRESDAFLDIFDAPLGPAEVRLALALVPRMQPHHQVRLFPFLRRSDPECFVETLCGIDFGTLCAADQISLIVALRQNAARPEVRRRQEELFVWDTLCPALQRAPDSLPLLAEAVQVVRACDFARALQYALRPEFYKRLIDKLCNGDPSLKIQCSFVLYYFMARGGQKTVQCLRQFCT